MGEGKSGLPDWISVNEDEGTVSLCHVTYSKAMFERLAFGATGQTFRLVKREGQPNILEAVLYEPAK